MALHRPCREFRPQLMGRNDMADNAGPPLTRRAVLASARPRAQVPPPSRSRRHGAGAGGGKTFVLVAGAWHGGWCWRRVSDRLEKKGHKVFSPTLTGVGERSHLLDAKINLATHIADIVNVIKWEDLNDIVLIGHSYAGVRHLRRRRADAGADCLHRLSRRVLPGERRKPGGYCPSSRRAMPSSGPSRGARPLSRRARRRRPM